jgi:hypothetical protein
LLIPDFCDRCLTHRIQWAVRFEQNKRLAATLFAAREEISNACAAAAHILRMIWLASRLRGHPGRGDQYLVAMAIQQFHFAGPTRQIRDRRTTWI